MDILHERTACDGELLVFAMTLVNKTLAALPDQDSFYDVTDCLESLQMEDVVRRNLSDAAAEPDLRAQFAIYEVVGGANGGFGELRYPLWKSGAPFPNVKCRLQSSSLV